MNIKRTLFGGVALMMLALVTTADAQVWTQYDIAIENRLFNPLAGGQVLQRSDFVDLFSNFVNPDDGVTKNAIPLGFDIEYNGQVYDRIFISVNGFASFQGRFIVNDPFTLFTPTNGPNLTLAPYFGDHYYRDPNFDFTDPSGRPFTPTSIKHQQNAGTLDPKGRNRRSFVIEWEDLNINYFFDPNDPDNPFAPNRAAQAPSIATFQLWIFEADANNAPSQRGTYEFHYGDAGTGTGTSVVKFSGASVGIEDEPAVPNGNTTWINAVTYAETGNKVLARTDTRLTSNWPPVGLPGRIFVFNGDSASGVQGWGDGDANLTQVDLNIPVGVRRDQRLFVTTADVIRILRHKAGQNVDFDSARLRHGYHGDVNHNGRFYWSTSNWNNTGDSIVSGSVVRYRVDWPVKSTNPSLPFPNDNTFNGFFFDANEFDAGLISAYLAAKLPVLPWLPDTLPHFTGKLVPIDPASDVVVDNDYVVTGNRVEIPVTVNGRSTGAMGIRLEAGEGTRIVDVYTPESTDERVSYAAATDDKVTIAAAGLYEPGDRVATIVVEADDAGNVAFDNVRFNDVDKGLKRFNALGAQNASAGALSVSTASPNPIHSNQSTTFDYAIPSDGNVTVRVFDMLGNEVATLVNSSLQAGSYSAEWNGNDDRGNQVKSGVYFIRVETSGESAATRVQITR
jgi:hypothetical protein